MRVSLFFTVLFGALALLSPESRSDEPQRVVIEKVEVLNARAMLSFHMSNPYSPELLEVIKSGIEVRFKYEVIIKRVHKNWFNSTQGAAEIQRNIKFEPLSNEYVIVDGSSGEKKFFPDLAGAIEGFFNFSELEIPLSSPSVHGKKYEISVRAQLDDLDVAGVFQHIPFVSNWFDVKTDWARIRVHARGEGDGRR